jgi:hypothetical protein
LARCGVNNSAGVTYVRTVNGCMHWPNRFGFGWLKASLSIIDCLWRALNHQHGTNVQALRTDRANKVCSTRWFVALTPQWLTSVWQWSPFCMFILLICSPQTRRSQPLHIRGSKSVPPGPGRRHTTCQSLSRDRDFVREC